MRKTIRILALALASLMIVALMPLNAFAASNALASKTIVAFGDSLTHLGATSTGTNDAFKHLIYSDAYPDFLGDELGVEVINAGVGGDVTGQGYARFQAEVLDENSDVVLICFGMNDQAVDTNKNVNFMDLYYYKYYLTYFVETLQARGCDAVFITPNPVYEAEGYYQDNPEWNYTYNAEGQMDIYCNAMREIAIKYGCGLVDINYEFNLLKQNDFNTFVSYYSDGIHQSTAGRKAWARYIADYLEAAYDGTNKATMTVKCVDENNKTVKTVTYTGAAGANITLATPDIPAYTTSDSDIKTTFVNGRTFTFTYDSKLEDLLAKVDAFDYTDYSEAVLQQIREEYERAEILLGSPAENLDDISQCYESLELLLGVKAGDALPVSVGKSYERTALNRDGNNDDLVKLTDGVKGTDNAESNAYAGWNQTELQTTYNVGNHVDVTVDLGYITSTNVYNIYHAGYSGWGISGPDESSKFNIFVSDDGENFTAVETQQTITSATHSNGTVTYKISLKSDKVISSRYVRFTINKSGFVWIDEVEAAMLGTALPFGTAISGENGSLSDGTQLYTEAPESLADTDNVVAEWNSSAKTYIITEVGASQAKLADGEIIVAASSNTALANAKVGQAINIYGVETMIGAYFEITDAPAENDGADDTNLARGKTVAISGSGVGYYYDDPTWGLASYQADLTDGVAAKSLEFNNDWFGFHHGTAAESNTDANGVGTAVIDLGGNYDLSKVRMHFRNMYMSAVKAPDSVVVSVASEEDSNSFKDVGTICVADADEAIYWGELECNTVARYVKFTVDLSSMFVFLNEIEVYGDSASDDDYNQEAPKTPVNLAKDRDYTVSVTNAPIIDNDYGTDYSALLTDGKAAAEFNSEDGSWFMFSTYYTNVENGVGSITIDFDNISKITSLGLHLCNMTSWGVNAPAAIEVYGSVNGIDYTKIGEMLTDSVDGTGYWSELRLNSVELGSIRFDFILDGNFALLNEIEVYGIATDTAYVPEEPSQDESSDPVEDESSEPIEDESSEPVEDESSEPVEDESSNPVGDETSEPVEDETSEPVEDETSEPVEDESSEPVEDETSEPVEDETSEPEESSSPEEPSNPDEPSEPVEDESSEPVEDATSEPEDEVIYNIHESVNVEFENDGAFVGGTVVTVEPADTNDYNGTVVDVFRNVISLKLKASKDGEIFIPDNSFGMSFAIPEGFSNNLSVFYIDENGELKEIDSTLDIEKGTVIITTDLLGTYVLVDNDSEVMLGDINGNGTIDSLDYILLKRAFFNTYKLDEEQSKIGDINGNGAIDSLDYILLKRAYFGTYKIK